MKPRELYVDLLTWAAKQRLRLTLSHLRRHDVLAMFNFDEYQQFYQPGRYGASHAGLLSAHGTGSGGGGPPDVARAPRPFRPPGGYRSPGSGRSGPRLLTFRRRQECGTSVPALWAAPCCGFTRMPTFL